MLRIGEVAKKYGISNRTLRYWEEVGVLQSKRTENGYRYYDSENVARINQIILLRKLKMPIADIERIFIANSYCVAIDALTSYLADLKQNAKLYNALAAIVENLLGNIQQSQNLEEIFLHIEQQESKPSPKIQRPERILAMETLKNVRILDLPPMTVMSYCVLSETPEADCSKVFDEVMLKHNLHTRSGHRSFGFNNPDPSNESPVYGYELWTTIPEDFEVPAPLVKKQFGGGKYASISASLNEIGERWDALFQWSTQNEKYENDLTNQWLEERVMDYEMFMSPSTPDSERQLDLLLPIKLK
ncbi:MAG: MerR family transcriptional regulator [Defluviitaleaceae bacterium]|nr:MerR family transcriptional regulator [Defluviitaleaceae bacterium]